MAETKEQIKLKLVNVHKAFGSKKVLSGVDLEIKKGESLVIIGGSGTGKSVTLKCILGLLNPDKGYVEIDGKRLDKLSKKEQEKVRSQIGMLFQSGALFDSLNVWENISFQLLQNKKTDSEKAKKLAIKKLAQVGLPKQVADVYPADLSGGMKKRVGLARAIANNPNIIFFDEPTTGLDPIMSDVINDLIVSCVKTLGATALTITHDMASARKIADRIAMLYEGEIIWVGTVKELDKTKNPYVRQFVAGSSKGPIFVEGKEAE
ncbi:MAG: ATP-binding cassette domain-containing protein [Alphaproteobacteria bacterium]|nr:ATP-binding cassette domain-containing protein [Alphaproteobacteria bacterium]